MAAVASAQDAYREMLSVGIRPELRKHGFTGSGGTFVWPSTSAHAHLGFQKRNSSTAQLITFTINVTVADRETWELARQARPHLPAKPSPNTYYGNDIWQRRIGNLLPSGNDTWWDVEADRDWRPTARAVVDAIVEHVVPELRARAGA